MADTRGAFAAGLIPVAFVQVQDVATNKPMPAEKVEDLIRSGTVPRVEDWKKATAAYKGNSIPLGRFDFPSGPQPSSTPPEGSVNGSSSSVSKSHARQQSAGGRQVASNYETQTAYQSQYQSSASHSTPSLASATPTPQTQNQDQRTEAGSEEDNYATVEELRERYGVIVHASVESFHFEQGHYWFHLRAHFSRPMPSDPSRDDVTILVLYRLYQDFYDFQIALMEAFPVEAGRVDRDGKALSQAESAGKRILPMMPGPTEHVDEIVCAQRVQDLSAYLDELSRLPFYIRECELVYELLGPREGDVELEGNPPPTGANNTTTAAAAEGEVVEYLERMGPSSSRTSANAAPPSSHASSASSQQQQAGAKGGAGTAMATAQQQGFLRIKIYQRRTDDLIAIRVPTNVSHAQLLDRVREKVGQNVSTMRFRDEAGDGYSTGGTPPVPANGGRLVALDNDEDLRRWLDAGSRMVLYAD